MQQISVLQVETILFITKSRTWVYSVHRNVLHDKLSKQVVIQATCNAMMLHCKLEKPILLGLQENYQGKCLIFDIIRAGSVYFH